MEVRTLKITDFRSVRELGPIELGRINVFIGANNTGKSTILRALHAMQASVGNLGPDIRRGANQAVIEMSVIGAPFGSGLEDGELSVVVHQGQPSGSLTMKAGPNHGTMARDQIPAEAPGHSVVPFLSNRKVGGYGENVGRQAARSVDANLHNLSAKLADLSDRAHPNSQKYYDACEAVLGFHVSSVQAMNGRRPGIYLDDDEPLPLEQMGDGVANIVGLLVHLATAQGKVILLEEPENDLHPEALKALLDLVVESAQNNQIIVSTHSNIVVRHLASQQDSRLYRVRADRVQQPTETTVELVESTPEARLEVLRELGYTFSDFDLWDGWVILEEASAERIIKDYLVRYFAPTLSRVRFLSARGNSQVESTFIDFHRLALFTHLEPAYRDRGWVLIDGDDHGLEIVEKLKSTFTNWRPDRFRTFSEARFENYYPTEFQAQVRQVFELPKKEQQPAKVALLDAVRTWLDEDENRSRQALEGSAKPVIDILREIEATLGSVGG